MLSPPLRGILLLDDDPAVNFLHELLFEEMAFCVPLHIFTEGLAALHFLSALRSDTGESIWPDLILVDVNMPGMDGFEFLDRYHSLPGGKGHTARIVMLTSSNYPRDVEKAHGYGITAYLSKPLTEEQLMGLVEQEWKPTQDDSSKKITPSGGLAF